MKFVGLTLLLITSNFFSFGQSFETRISGKLTYDSKEPIPGASISIFQENELLISTTSDANGEFSMLIELMDQTDYQLIVEGGDDAFPIHEILHFNTASYHQDYLFEISVPTPLIDSDRGQVAYYAKNETKTFEGFEVEQIRMILKKYPESCIEFSQTIVRDESEKIAEKRKVAFLKSLETAGVDMRCIQFDPITRTLRAFDEDQRSRIQGAIVSLESRCE